MMKILFTLLISSVSLFANRMSEKATPTHHFDLLHTDLNLKPLWATHQLEGEAVLKFKPYFYPQDKITLDAKSFRIVEVSLKRGKEKLALDYNYNQRKLLIFLNKTYTQKDSFELYIKYVANPDSVATFSGKAITDEKGMYFINTDLSQKNVSKHLWTQGETEANSTWFPTIDIPSEKHTQRIKVTYEKNMVSLSNGKLSSSKLNLDGSKTDVWDQTLPHSVYLSVLVIGDFKIVKDKWRDKEVSYYMEPKYEPMARPIFGRTPEMMEFFSKKLGFDFPWDKYSQVIVHEFVAGAMENTSAVTFNTSYQKDARDLVDDNDDETVAHELMHHWFGDLVTCEDWTHLTLNESFANYAEYLWLEYKYGIDVAQYHWQRDMTPYFSMANSKKEPLVRYEYEKPDDMFDMISYNKGGKIVHMLRTYLGDEAFFEAIKLYLKRFAYKTAEYSDLRKCVEEISGEDMKWFFDQWYLKGGHPVITSSYAMQEDQVILRLNQKHNFDTSFIYKLPLDIDLYGDTGVMRKRIVLESRKDSFRFKLKGFKGLVVDATNSLVGLKNESRTTEEWIYVLQHSKSYIDQSNALKKLYSKKSKEEVKKALSAQLDSKNPRIIGAVIKLIDEDWLTGDSTWNRKLRVIAQNHSRGFLRAASLNKLAENKSLVEYRDLIEKKLQDSSYLVEAEALNMLSKVDSQAALNYALKCIRYNNYSILSKAFELIGKTNQLGMLKYFEEGIEHASGFKALAIYSRFGTFVASQSDTMFNAKLISFKNLKASKNGTDKFSGTYALNAMKTVLAKKDDEFSKKRLERVEAILKDSKEEEVDEH